MTEQAEKILRYEKRQRGLELKKHLATVAAKLGEYSHRWRELGDTFKDCERNSYVIGEDTITVRREPPSYMRDMPRSVPSPALVVSVALSWLDVDELTLLLRDLEETKRELQEIEKFCAEIGDPLH